MSAWWKVEEDERPVVYRLWTAGLMLGGGIMAAKAASDTLLLSRTDLELLPRLYLIVAAVLFLGGAAYRRVADRLPKAMLAFMIPLGTAVVLALGSLATDFAPPAWANVLYVSIYCLAELGNAVNVISYWALASDQFTSAQGKRLFSLVGSGLTAGGMVGGALVGSLAGVVGPDRLLLLAAVIFALQAVPLVVSPRRSKGGKSERPSVFARERRLLPPQMAKPASTRTLINDRHVRLLALLTLFILMATTLTDYQWKVLVASRYEEAALARFYGVLFIVLGGLGLAVQVLVAARVIMRLGNTWSLLCLPGGLLLGSIGILVSPGVAAAVILEGSDRLINRTIHASSMQLQYLPVPVRRRGQVKAFIDGQVRPVTKALGALLLLGVGFAFRGTPPERIAWYLSWLVAALLTGTFVVVWKINSSYVASMWRSISARLSAPAEEKSQDALALTALDYLFRYGAPRQVLGRLDLLDRLSYESRRLFLQELLDRHEPEILAPALERWGDVAHPEEQLAAWKWLHHESPDVRSAAVSVVSRGPVHEVEDALLPLAEDDAPQVRAAVAQWLMLSRRDGHGERGRLIVNALSSSADPTERKLAARVIGGTTRAELKDTLAGLLYDPDTGVCVAAIRAVGRGRYDSLRRSLYSLLTDHSVQSATMRTLVNLGSIVCHDAREFLASYGQYFRLCNQLPAVLAEIDDPMAMTALEEALAIEDLALRRRVGLALVTRQRLGFADASAGTTAVKVLDDFVARTRSLNTIVAAFYRDNRLRGVYSILLSERHYSAEAVGVWLSVAYPERPMEDIVRAANFGDREQRDTARELLGLVTGEDRGARVWDALTARMPSVHLSVEDAVVAALYDASEWSRIAGAIGAVVLGLTQVAPLMESAPAQMLETPGGKHVQEIWQGAVAKLSGATQDSRQRSTDEMWSQVERVMALKGVPLFAGLDAEAIWHIASIVDEQHLETGESIVVEGQPAQALFILMTGEVTVHKGEDVLNTIGPGEVIGEMGILDDAPASASVTTASDVTLFRLGSGPFYALMASHFEIARAVIGSLTQRLRTTSQQEAASR